MPTFTSTISRMKSVKLPFKKTPKEVAEEEEEDRSVVEIKNETKRGNLPITNKSFTEALVIISKETKNTEFDDVFDSFFFNDKRCQNRALFMAARLKQSLDVKLPEQFWRLVTHRLYTLNYILFVLPTESINRRKFLEAMSKNTGKIETKFAVEYALDHIKLKRRKTLLEDAFELEKRNSGGVGSGVSNTQTLFDKDKTLKHADIIIEQCLESESKLGHSEKDAMYVFHSLRAGLLDAFVIHIQLDEDRELRHLLKSYVRQNTSVYKNPFEDEDCIVNET